MPPINEITGLKLCTVCGKEKPREEFGNTKHSKDGLTHKCKVCKNAANREWAVNNKEYITAKNDKWHKDNPEKVAAKKKRYRVKNKKKIIAYNTAYEKKKMQEDPCFKLAKASRIRLNRAMKEYMPESKRAGSAVRDLGCSLEEFRGYIERQFYPNPRTGEDMTWENHGMYGWHLDHKIPLNSFDLTDREQFVKAVHYTNIQPLWAKENMEKADKLDWKKQDMDNVK
jgi:hypothetical protein